MFTIDDVPCTTKLPPTYNEPVTVVAEPDILI